MIRSFFLHGNGLSKQLRVVRYPIDDPIEIYTVILSKSRHAALRNSSRMFDISEFLL